MSESVIDRCYNYKGVHIPGCMGCAVHGHSHCTCAPVPKRIKHPVEELRTRLLGIEREMAALRKVCEQLAKDFENQSRCETAREEKA